MGASVIRYSAYVNNYSARQRIYFMIASTIMENPISEIQRMLDESSQIDVAKELGVSPQYLSDVVNERRKPGKKILKPLGLERVTSYRRTRKG